MTIGLPVAVRSVAASVLVSRGATPPEPTASNTAGGTVVAFATTGAASSAVAGGAGARETRMNAVTRIATAATDTATGSGPRQTDRRAGRLPRRGRAARGGSGAPLGHGRSGPSRRPVAEVPCAGDLRPYRLPGCGRIVAPPPIGKGTRS